MPPRVPNGSPSMWSFCAVSCGTSNTACVGAVSVPMARRLILPAADRYASISAGDIVSVPAMLSKPWVESSGGQELRGVDFERQQIADRVRVFGAVQPVKARRRQMRLGVRSSSFSIQATSASRVSPVERRTAVRRRHQARAQLADDLFPGLCIRRHGVEMRAPPGSGPRPARSRCGSRGNSP